MTAAKAPGPRWRELLTLSTCALLMACNGAKKDALPEWTPADHTNQANPAAGQVDTTQQRKSMEELEKEGVNDVVFAAWKANCMACHGMTGKGDGPQGRMLHPPDMTDPGWQRTRIDSEMKRTIQKGRGKMPAFAQLPEPTVDGLVKLVRMLNPEFHKKPKAEAPPAPEPAP